MSALISSGIKVKDLPKDQWPGKRCLIDGSHVTKILRLCEDGVNVVVRDDDNLYPEYLVPNYLMHYYEYLID